MAMREIYRKQVQLLVRTLPFVQQEDAFALKGGTAINLFVRNLPRLSVDIDLTYLPIKSRPDSLQEIEASLTHLASSISGSMSGVQVSESRLDRDGTLCRLIVRAEGVQIKVEVSPVTRGCVYEPKLMQVCAAVEDEFGFAETKIVSFDDLYAGKLVAALDRQHPRDLFDVRDLLAHEGITETLRNAFLVYIVSHNRPACDVLAPNRKNLQREFDQNFAGMTSDPVWLEDLYATREEMIELIVAQMPQSHRDFLISLERGDENWQSIGLDIAANLPAVRWKQLNLDKVESNKRQVAADKLASIWD